MWKRDACLSERNSGRIHVAEVRERRGPMRERDGLDERIGCVQDGLRPPGRQGAREVIDVVRHGGVRETRALTRSMWTLTASRFGCFKSSVECPTDDAQDPASKAVVEVGPAPDGRHVRWQARGQVEGHGRC